ncbi:extracellular solute-binding protein [Nocardia higoensis]|uniref:Extracellular solute-binding protein n=1 Tax=Nocardia higoensis TaxID=228599 RepID=A0ABS0DAK2_9NOCA|nr:extracellular solute-binding protein [Nocardia higoensis]MBF6354662.1 extracellular solute-binding protein [Nocardia higoensis]
MNRTILRLATLGAVAALGLTACSSGEDADSASGDAVQCVGSGDPNTLTVYSGRTEKLVKPLFDRVDESVLGPGVKLEALYDQKPVKILEEGPRSPADVWFGQDAGELGALGEAGYLSELPDSVVNLVPEEYVDPGKRWAAVTLRSRVLAYDPRQVPEAELPTGIDALVDEKWRGAIAYAPTNASWKSFVTALRVLRGEEGAREWLEKFKAVEPVEFDGNNALLTAVEQGQVKVGLTNHYYWFMKTAAEGAENVRTRIHYFKGDTEPGALVNISAAGILNCSDNKEAAVRLVEFLLAPDSQQYFADQTGEYPVVAGVTPRHDLPPLAELDPPAIDLNELQSLAATEELLKDVGLLK